MATGHHKQIAPPSDKKMIAPLDYSISYVPQATIQLGHPFTHLIVLHNSPYSLVPYRLVVYMRGPQGLSGPFGSWAPIGS